MSAATEKDIQSGAVIAIEHLSKAFGGRPVLNDLSLKLYPEENLVVLGKSGSGKSVLIKLIVGLLAADSGSIKVYGHEITQLEGEELDRIRQKIGFLFQSGALYDSMSVRQNMEFPLSRIHKELSRQQRMEKIMEVLESVGLADAVDKMPSELSGGMRKRIGLARTIVVDPGIMLYDEPTTGLDPATSDEISTLILDVQQKYKTASIIITHDMACAGRVANRMLMVKDGRVYKEGVLKDFETSGDEIIQSFFKSNRPF